MQSVASAPGMVLRQDLCRPSSRPRGFAKSTAWQVLGTLGQLQKLQRNHPPRYPPSPSHAVPLLDHGCYVPNSEAHPHKFRVTSGRAQLRPFFGGDAREALALFDGGPGALVDDRLALGAPICALAFGEGLALCAFVAIGLPMLARPIVAAMLPVILLPPPGRHLHPPHLGEVQAEGVGLGRPVHGEARAEELRQAKERGDLPERRLERVFRILAE